MTYLTRSFASLRSLLARTRRWPSPLASGIAVLVVASAFLLQVSWGAAPAPGVAALPAQPGGLRAGVATPDEVLWRASALPGGEETPGLQAAGPLIDWEGLTRLAQLLVARQPAPAPAATPASPSMVALRPAPPAGQLPSQVVAAPQEEPAAPAATPQPASAPREEPAAPPAAPREPTPTPQPPPTPACPTASMSDFAQALFEATNSERVQAGLPALALDSCVVYVAILRSEDMASQGYFAHTSPEGDNAFSLMTDYGVPYGWAGENLARNNYTDDETVEVAINHLMASEGHRANILSVNYTSMGVGAVADGAGMKYYTMIFVGPP